MFANDPTDPAGVTVPDASNPGPLAARPGAPAPAAAPTARPWQLTRHPTSHKPRQPRSGGARIRCGCLAHAHLATWLTHPRLLAAAPVAGDTRRGMAGRRWCRG